VFSSNDLAALSLRLKRKPVEVHLNGIRLNEELGLLEDEMYKFLCYYKDNILSSLDTRLRSIVNGLYIWIYKYT
jgi:hypothetical protein